MRWSVGRSDGRTSYGYRAVYLAPLPRPRLFSVPVVRQILRSPGTRKRMLFLSRKAADLLP